MIRLNISLICLALEFSVSSVWAQQRFELNAPANRRTVSLQDIEPRSAYRLVPLSLHGGGRTLAIDRDGNLLLRGIVDDDSQTWHLTSLAPGLFRIHSDARGRRWSLAGRPEDAPRLARTSDSLDQLWQLVAVPGEPGNLVLANVGAGVTPKVLACDSAGRLTLATRNWSDGQMWRLVKLNRRLPPVFGEYEFVSREVRPNRPLPPAQVELNNSHSKELWILLVDRYAADGGMRMKLPPGQSKIVALERDSGATLVEIYERGLPTGALERDEFVTPLPPAPRYDATVYELIVQSISIDATVPGGKVDDVQYAPKSLGWFELPPGPLLQDGPLDVYPVAKAQNNPGLVRRIDSTQWQPRSTTPDPVESLLNKYQKKSSQ